MTSTVPVTTLLFDMDGCLYSCPSFLTHIHENIFKFMVSQTGSKFDPITTIDEAKAVWAPIFAKYNLTKRGLQGEGYVFDETSYDDFIRQGLENFIQPNPDLRALIMSLPQARKAVLTNCPERHAVTTLELLGIRDCFDDVFGTDFMGPMCKPARGVFEKTLEALGNPRPGEVAFFEDSFVNLQAGKELGFRTVFVKSEASEGGENRSDADVAHFDCACNTVVNETDLRAGAEWLWAT